MQSAPHPLAEALIEGLQKSGEARVLDFGSGSGRNSRALRSAGLEVVAIDDDTAASAKPFRGVAGSFDAAISTHGLLHGTPAAIASNVAAIAGRLKPRGWFYATFGSTRDARFGRGRRLGDATFAPIEGDEEGVAHTYFDRVGLEALLAAHFRIESLQEHGADAIAGRWAHPLQPLRDAVHWLAVARGR